MDVDFVEWLREEMDKRDWNPSKLARKMGISQPQVTRVMNREQKPGLSFLNGVSGALGVPLEVLLRHAGILPRKQNSLLIEKMSYLFEKLDKDEQQRIVDELAIKNELQERKRNAVHRSHAPGS